jgi:hypothetical protein
MNIAFGYNTTLLKSSILKDNPKPSIIIPRANGKNRLVIKLDSIFNT